MNERIKKFRLKAQLMQSEVAKLIGVKQSAVSMWETGNAQPSIANLKKLAALFGCTVSDLIDDPVED